MMSSQNVFQEFGDWPTDGKEDPDEHSDWSCGLGTDEETESRANRLWDDLGKATMRQRVYLEGAARTDMTISAVDTTTA